MQLSQAFYLALGVATASPLEQRQSCPNVHIFGARETTVPSGYGSAGTFINLILNAYPSATAEVINYPAQGGTNEAYAASVRSGTQNVANQINNFNSRCPSTRLIYVGYSQGAQIMDNALCGGGDPNQGITNTASLISSAAANQLKAVIWAGDPRHAPGSPYNYGTATAGGFDPRPQGFSCSPHTSKIRSYCDRADPYCSNGNDGNVHQGYGNAYGQNALSFVRSKLG